MRKAAAKDSASAGRDSSGDEHDGGSASQFNAGPIFEQLFLTNVPRVLRSGHGGVDGHMPAAFALR